MSRAVSNRSISGQRIIILPHCPLQITYQISQRTYDIAGSPTFIRIERRGEIGARSIAYLRCISIAVYLTLSGYQLDQLVEAPESASTNGSERRLEALRWVETEYQALMDYSDDAVLTREREGTLSFPQEMETPRHGPSNDRLTGVWFRSR